MYYGSPCRQFALIGTDRTRLRTYLTIFLNYKSLPQPLSIYLREHFLLYIPTHLTINKLMKLEQKFLIAFQALFRRVAVYNYRK